MSSKLSFRMTTSEALREASSAVAGAMEAWAAANRPRLTGIQRVLHGGRFTNVLDLLNDVQFAQPVRPVGR